MPTCLNGLVGIESPCDDTRVDGIFYVDDLGVSLRKIGQINSDFKDSLTLFNRKASLAQSILLQDFKSFYNGQFMSKSILSNRNVGFYRPDKVHRTVTGKGGLVFDIEVEDYFELFIHDVTIFPQADGDLDLIIYDLLQGKEIYRDTKTVVGGEINRFAVNQLMLTYGQEVQYLVGFDFSNTVIYDSQTIKDWDCDLNTCYRDGYFSIWGGVTTAVSPTENYVNRNANTYGVTSRYSLNCSSESFICTLRNELQVPLGYLVAAEIAKDFIRSDRNTQHALYMEADWKKIQEEYENKYNVWLYGMTDSTGKSTKLGLLDRVQMPKGDCFVCRPKVVQRTVVP